MPEHIPNNCRLLAQFVSAGVLHVWQEEGSPNCFIQLQRVGMSEAVTLPIQDWQLREVCKKVYHGIRPPPPQAPTKPTKQ